MAPQAEDDDLKGTGSKEAEIEMKTSTQQFFHFCLLKIHVFERTTVAVTILCPATYITDVINEAKLCVLNTSRAKPFLLFTGKE